MSVAAWIQRARRRRVYGALRPRPKGPVEKLPFYVSPSGYGSVCCGLCTQGGALPLGRLGAKLTLGCSMKPLRGKRHEVNAWLFQQARVAGQEVRGQPSTLLRSGDARDTAGKMPALRFEDVGATLVSAQFGARGHYFCLTRVSGCGIG